MGAASLMRWPWGLKVTPKTATASDFTCAVEVELLPVLGVLARLSLLGHFLGRHVAEKPWASPPTSTTHSVNRRQDVSGPDTRLQAEPPDG